jgi:hypothetical protein
MSNSRATLVALAPYLLFPHRGGSNRATYIAEADSLRRDLCSN